MLRLIRSKENIPSQISLLKNSFFSNLTYILKTKCLRKRKEIFRTINVHFQRVFLIPELFRTSGYIVWKSCSGKVADQFYKKDAIVDVFLWLLRNFLEQLIYRIDVNGYFWLSDQILLALHKKWSFPIRITLVNVTKSEVQTKSESESIQKPNPNLYIKLNWNRIS